MKRWLAGCLAVGVMGITAGIPAGRSAEPVASAAPAAQAGDSSGSAGERLGLFQSAREQLAQELRAGGFDVDMQIVRAADKMVQTVSSLTGSESEQTRRGIETALSRGALLFTKLAKQVREFTAAAAIARFSPQDRSEAGTYFMSASRAAALCVTSAADGQADASERAAIDFQIALLQAQETAGILLNANTAADIDARLKKVGSDKALGTNKYYQQVALVQTDLLRKRYAAERGMILGHFATQTGPTQREELTLSYEHALDQLLKNCELLAMVKQEAEGVIGKAYEQKNKVLEGALNGGGEPVSGSSFLQSK